MQYVNMEMGAISILQGKKPTNINISCLSLMLISSSDFSVPKINHRIAETPKQSTKPVVHLLQSTEELQLTNTDVRPGRGGFCSAARQLWMPCGAVHWPPPQSPAWATRQRCATGWHGLGNWDLSPCSPSLLPSHRAQDAAPRCLTPVLLLAVVGVWGALPGDWCGSTHDAWGEFPITCS